MSETESLHVERTLAASPDLIWAMWTEPARFASWYGPDGATVSVEEMDLRVDGPRRVAMEMETPGGPMRMHFGGTHTAVEPESRLSYTEAMTDETGTALPSPGGSSAHATSTQVTVELSPAAEGGTRMALTHAGVAADSPGAVGWRMALDKLEAVVTAS